MQLAEPRWAVTNSVPEGLTILAGRPKLGKSWLMLGVAIAVASGGCALGQIEVAEGDVLYLALEDSWRRLQQRLLTQLAGSPAPERLEFERESLRGEAGVAKIDAWLQGHPQARLVVIDTLAKFRAPTRRERSYDTDYSDIVPLQQLAVKYGVAIVVVHHLRKLGSDDWTDQVSGTLGLVGAADGLLGLFRTRGEMQAELRVAGRDVEEQTLGLRFDATTCNWSLLGDAAATVAISAQRRGILVLLEKTGPLAPSVIAKALNRNPSTVKTTLQDMARDGQVIANGGVYTTSRLSHPVVWTKTTQTTETTDD
jgi:hypothetical protein